MDESLVEVAASNDDPEEKTPKLLVVITGDNNQKLEKVLRTWVKDEHKTRNLSMYNPVHLNPGTLMLDDTEYTRSVCVWLKSRFIDKVKIFEAGELFTYIMADPNS